ncbi:MAG: hypothetical protein M0Q95_16265 [Porticoccaceae bacterium]|nr:hypothetical protein [Porticoccaceae bacterium]
MVPVFSYYNLAVMLPVVGGFKKLAKNTPISLIKKRNFGSIAPLRETPGSFGKSRLFRAPVNRNKADNIYMEFAANGDKFHQQDEIKASEVAPRFNTRLVESI